MRLTVCAVHLILIGVNNLDTCTHIWGLTNSHVYTVVDGKPGRIIMVYLFCSEFDDTLIS
jgi:hypothetical protein